MCRPKPYPRCANHSRTQLSKAREALASDPNDPKLLDAVARAQHEYDLTDTGRRELQAEVERLSDLDPVASAEVQKRLDALNDEYRKRVEEASFLDGSYSIEEVVLLAEDKTTTPATLAFLASHADASVRDEVAYNPNTPAEALARLASDEDDAIRGAVARHPNTPVETLDRLARDAASGCRAAVAENSSTPAKTLVHLSEDGDWKVRAKVARNPNCPVETLNTLADDSSTGEFFARRGDLEAEDGVRLAVAKNPNTPAEALVRLADDSDWEVRAEVAAHSNTPYEVLHDLTDEHEHIAVIHALTLNPNSSEVPEQLLDDMRNTPEWSDWDFGDN